MALSKPFNTIIMAICDVCSVTGNFKHINASSIKTAVSNGFNPWKLGLVSTRDINRALAGINKVTDQQAFLNWKNNTVMPDTTPWNVCPRCNSHLNKYLSKSSITKKWWRFWAK